MGPLKPLLDNIHAYVVSAYPDPSSLKEYLHTGDPLGIRFSAAMVE